MTKLERGRFLAGDVTNYLIAGNVCNSFVLGEPGASDDFFLVGAEPEEESYYPLLTGNILAADGQVLFRLVRNVLRANPGRCLRVIGDRLGYEIHDRQGKVILKVQSTHEQLSESGDRLFVTTISGNFYNRKGELVFLANSGEADEHLAGEVKCALGFKDGEFGHVRGLSDEEIGFARLALASRGAIHEQLEGDLDSQEILLDGKVISSARLTNCKIHIKTGKFGFWGQSSFDRCQFFFQDAAENIAQLLENVAPRPQS